MSELDNVESVENQRTLYTPQYVLFHILRPTLVYLNLPQPEPGGSSERLLISTAAHESLGFTRVYQMGAGPALSFCQIEPFTARDLWTRYVIGRTNSLALKLQSLVFPEQHRSGIPLNPTEVMLRQLAINHPLAFAIARLKYFSSPFIMKDVSELTPEDYAHVWKMYYNTPGGKGTIEEFLENYHEYVAPLYVKEQS